MYEFFCSPKPNKLIINFFLEQNPGLEIRVHVCVCVCINVKRSVGQRFFFCCVFCFVFIHSKLLTFVLIFLCVYFFSGYYECFFLFHDDDGGDGGDGDDAKQHNYDYDQK